MCYTTCISTPAPSFQIGANPWGCDPWGKGWLRQRPGLWPIELLAQWGSHLPRLQRVRHRVPAHIQVWRRHQRELWHIAQAENALLHRSDTLQAPGQHRGGGTLLWLRPRYGAAAYRLWNASSRMITVVKQCWARLVLGYGRLPFKCCLSVAANP